LRLDDKDGPILSSIDIPNTGGWNNWKLMSAPFIKQTTGIHNIVCTFKGNGANLFDINWIRITSNTMSKKLIKHPLEKGYKINKGEKEIGYINDTGWVKYEKVDFGKGKLKIMKAMVRSGSNGGTLEIRLDKKEGPILTSIKITNTGGWKKWKLVSAPITEQAEGVKDIYLLFKGDGKNLYNVNRLRFSSDAVPSSKKAHPWEEKIQTATSGKATLKGAETIEERGRRYRDIPKGKKLGLPLGQIIAIKASNGKYLATKGETLEASSETIGPSERFTVLSEAGGLVSIKSLATKKYISTRLNTTGIPVLVSGSGTAKSWEQYSWQKLGPIQFTLKNKSGNLIQLNDDDSTFTGGKGSKLSGKALLVFEITK